MLNSLANSQWIIAVLIILLIFLALIRFMFSKEMNNYIKATVNNQLSVRLFLEANALSNRVSFFLNIIFVLNFGVLIYFIQVINEFEFYEYSGFVMMLLSVALVIVVYLGKYLFLKLLGYIFFIQQELNEYIHNIFLYNKFFGICLLPILICLPFIEIEIQEILIYISVSLFFVFFIARIIRGIGIAIKNKLSVFYIFLYLCTLEILPALIFYKIYTLYLAG